MSRLVSDTDTYMSVTDTSDGRHVWCLTLTLTSRLHSIISFSQIIISVNVSPIT